MRAAEHDTTGVSSRVRRRRATIPLCYIRYPVNRRPLLPSAQMRRFPDSARRPARRPGFSVGPLARNMPGPAIRCDVQDNPEAQRIRAPVFRGGQSWTLRTALRGLNRRCQGLSPNQSVTRVVAGVIVRCVFRTRFDNAASVHGRGVTVALPSWLPCRRVSFRTPSASGCFRTWRDGSTLPA